MDHSLEKVSFCIIGSGKHFDDVLSKTVKEKETEQDNSQNKIIRLASTGLNNTRKRIAQDSTTQQDHTIAGWAGRYIAIVIFAGKEDAMINSPMWVMVNLMLVNAMVYYCIGNNNTTLKRSLPSNNEGGI